MKIHSNEQQIQQIATVQPVKPAAESKKSAATAAMPGGPSVDLSPEGQMIKSATNAVNQSPSIREDKVAQLKAQVQNGTYQVDSEKLAGILNKVLPVNG